MYSRTIFFFFYYERWFSFLLRTMERERERILFTEPEAEQSENIHREFTLLLFFSLKRKKGNTTCHKYSRLFFFFWERGGRRFSKNKTRHFSVNNVWNSRNRDYTRVVFQTVLWLRWDIKGFSPRQTGWRSSGEFSGVCTHFSISHHHHHLTKQYQNFFFPFN